MAMATVLVHMEMTDDGVVWWGETVDVPGFYAAADSLQELMTQTELAIAELRAEGEAPEGELEFRLMGVPEESSNPVMIQAPAQSVQSTPAAARPVLVA